MATSSRKEATSSSGVLNTNAIIDGVLVLFAYYVQYRLDALTGLEWQMTTQQFAAFLCKEQIKMENYPQWVVR